MASRSTHAVFTAERRRSLRKRGQLGKLDVADVRVAQGPQERHEIRLLLHRQRRGRISQSCPGSTLPSL
jgi:hypothetical protein